MNENTQPKNQLQIMDDLIAKKMIITVPKIGEIVRGKVISISSKEVLIDLAGLSTGIVRGRELYDASGEYSELKVGDDVQATVIDIENERGELELSFALAGHQKAWDHLENVSKENKIVQAKIVSANKGGLMAKIGHIVGFLPVSQLSPENYPRVEGGDKVKILEKLNKLVNKHLDVKVIDVDEKDEKLIVSEKAAWEEKQQSTISKYKVGNVVEGKVTGIINFGVFVEFGDGLEGLVHISELAWQRIEDPSQVVKVGDHVQAKIISIDGSRISLSMKKLQQDPWLELAKKYKVGDMVEGKIIKVNPFGFFVELDADIHGLAHISELSDKPITSPEPIAKENDTLKFRIISIEPHNHRLGLSLKLKSEKKSSEKDEKPVTPSAAPETKEEETAKSNE